MTIIEILKKAFSLYKNNFSKFLGIALPGAPIVILSVIVLIFTVLSASIPQTDKAMAAAAAKYIPAMILDFGLMSLFSSIVAASGTIVISEQFLERDIEIADAYRKVLNRFFPLLGAIILSSVITGLVTILGLSCVIPGIAGWIFLSTWFGLIAQIVMIEGEGGMGAMKRSRILIKENFRKSIIVIGSVLAATAIGWVFLIAGDTMAKQFNIVILTPIGGLLSILALILVEPIKFTAITLLYYDLRIRREGFDLKIMEEELSAEI